MKKLKGRISALALCLLAASCQNPVTPSLPLDDLLAAPQAVEINGRQFKLETFVWRDLMPTSDPNGFELNAAVYLTAIDGQPFPDFIDSNRIWVINGENVWETTFRGELRPRDSEHLYQLEKVANGGPRWDVGAQVEVVVRVTRLMAAPCLLRATKQTIDAAY